MKKIILTLVVIILASVTSHAQLIHTTEFVKIDLPSGAAKMSKQQVDALPGHSVTFSKSKVDYSPPYNYEVAGVSFSFFKASQDSVNNDLPAKKIFQDELNSFLRRNGNNTYKSGFRKIGNKQALIISYMLKNRAYYRFYLQNEFKTLTQAGFMECPETDTGKAEELLNEILKNTQFTK